MTRLLFLVVGPLLMGPAVIAQCNLMISTFTINTQCGDYPHASVHYTGGTAPFTLSFVTNGQVTTAQNQGSNWTGLFYISEWDSEVTLTITDALNCTDTRTETFDRYVILVPSVIVDANCDDGVTLTWNGQYLYGPYLVTSYCASASSMRYSLYNYTTNTGYGGIVGVDWVQGSGNSWRYPGPVPAGGYFLDIHPNTFNGNDITCTFGDPVECFRPYIFTTTFDPGDCGSNFRLRAALAGALPSGTLMTDQLRSAGLLPLIEPYSAGGYSYVGAASGTSIPASMLTVTGSNAIADWVVVEVRQPNAPYAVLHSRPALIQRDGDVIDASGSSTINTPLPPGSYRIAIRHRNHLGVMSNSTALSSDPAGVLVDLTSLSTSVYGSNARVAVGSVQCLWPGDGNGNGTVQYTGSNNDRDPILVAIGGSVASNTVTNVYSPLDINMNGTISYTGIGNDRDVILQTIGGSVAWAVRMQQLP